MEKIKVDAYKCTVCGKLFYDELECGDHEARCAGFQEVQRKRKELKVTALNLCNMTGINFSSFNQWVSGRSLPKKIKIDVMLKVLDEIN